MELSNFVTEWRGKALVLHLDMFEEYLFSLKQRNVKQDTIKGYRRDLQKIYHFLPEEKVLKEENIAEWIQYLREAGYADRTINHSVSVLNGLLEYCNCHELKVKQYLPTKNQTVPQLTRQEYRIILQKACEQRNEKGYLLVKIFGTMGIPPRYLPLLTVEAIQTGEVRTGGGLVIRIPKSLREELKDYSTRKGLEKGPVFVTSGGKPIDRKALSMALHTVFRNAGVSENKGNAGALCKLYRGTKAEIAENMNLIIEQMLDRIIETERTNIRWSSQG